MRNLNVYTLMTAPLTGVAKELSTADLRIAADVGRLAVGDYLRGLSAIGNLTAHACDNENYTDHAHDLPALADLLKHTAHMARAARFYSDHADYLADEMEHGREDVKPGGENNANS